MYRIIFLLLLLPLIAAAEPATIKIGALQPLSGEGAFWGESARKGIELAVRDANARKAPGEPKLEVVFEDDRCDPKTSVTAYQKLIDLDKVFAIVGPGCSAGALSVGPRASKDKTVVLTCTEADAVSDIGGYVFRMWVPNGRVAEKLTDYAFKTLGARKLAILAMQNDYGISIGASGRRNFEKLGGTVVAEEQYVPSSSDMHAEILRIKSKNPDVILLANYIKDGITIVKQLRELKIETPILAGSAANTEEFKTAVGSLGDGIVVADLPDTVNEEFRSRWKKEFGTDWPGMGSCAGMGYDSVGMLDRAFSNGAKSGEDLRFALEKMRDYSGVTGLLGFDGARNLELSHRLFVLRNGKSEPLPPAH